MVVVIAILASITIVSYNGITSRANESAALTTLRQIDTAIKTKQVELGSLPNDLSETALSTSLIADTTYWLYNDSELYCISVEKGNQAYHLWSNGSNNDQLYGCDDVRSVVSDNYLGFANGENVTTSFAPISGTPNITLYAALEVNDTSSNYFTTAGLGPVSAGNRMQLDLPGTGNSGLRYRIDTSAQSDITATQPNVRTTGPHIGWLKVSNNMTERSFAYDQVAPYATTSMSTGTGWVFSTVFTSWGNSSQMPYGAVAYNANHDEATRSMILQWFIHRYNMSISL